MTMHKVSRITALAILLAATLFCLTSAYQTADQIRSAYAPYSFRYNEAFSSSQIQAAHNFQESSDGALYSITLWNETKEELKTDLHSTDAQVIAYSGDVATIFPAVYIQGTAPGAADTDGCAVSEAIAWDLFGSTDIVGQTLQIGNRNAQIRGVFQSQCHLALIAARETDALKNAELAGSPAGDSREMAIAYVTSAGLGAPDQICTGKTWGEFFVALCSVPVLIALVWLLVTGFRMSLHLSSWFRAAVWFVAALVFALLLPHLLGQLPSWLLPAQWSNLGFWPDLVITLNERLNETLALVPTTRDILAKRWALAFTLWLLTCLGALGGSLHLSKQIEQRF